MTTTVELVKEVAAALAAQTPAVELSQVQVAAVLKQLTATVESKLVAGEDLRLHGLGTFSVVEKAARAGRNPTTGAAIQIAARKTVKFTVTKPLKDLVKNT